MILKCVIIFYLFITLYHVQCKMKKHIGSACVGQDNITGTCLDLYKCPSAVIIFLYYNHGYDVPSLPEVCAYDDTEPVVCCTDCFIDDDEDKTSQFYQLDRFGALVNTQHKPEAAASCHYFFIKEPYPCLSMESFEVSKYLASNKTCHLWRVESSANVSTVGDGATEKTELRYLVLIGYGEDKVDPQWWCQGVAVNWNHILITAHCATHPTRGPAKYVVTGLHKPEQEWNIHDIRKIHIHPDYKPPSRYHDIALLYIAISFDFDKDFLPACMDTTNFIHRAVQGVYWDWNRFRKSNESAYNQQMVVQFKLDDAKCKELFPPDDLLEHGYDPLTQTCYGIPDQIVDNCDGNSSGLIQTSYHDCQYTVTGVKVYSKGCGVEGGASLYTRVQHYMPWIEGIIWPSNDDYSLDSSEYDSDNESDNESSSVSPEYDEGDESDEDK